MEQRSMEVSEPLIAYVYGDDVAPDFAALAACGFTIVCLDKSAPWFREEMIAEARRQGLTAIAFEMNERALPKMEAPAPSFTARTT